MRCLSTFINAKRKYWGKGSFLNHSTLCDVDIFIWGGGTHIPKIVLVVKQLKKKMEISLSKDNCRCASPYAFYSETYPKSTI